MSELTARTPDEKARATFFDKYGGPEPIEPGTTTVTPPGHGVPPLPPGAPPPTYVDFLLGLVCDKDAVVLGRPKLRKVLLNERQSYLFSEYDVAIERWLYPTGHGRDSITISLPGGRAHVRGVPIVVGHGRPLDPSRRYIFLLTRIPGSASLTPRGTPITEGDHWPSVVRTLHIPPELRGEAVRLDTLAYDIEQIRPLCRSERGR